MKPLLVATAFLALAGPAAAQGVDRLAPDVGRRTDWTWVFLGGIGAGALVIGWRCRCRSAAVAMSDPNPSNMDSSAVGPASVSS